MESPELMNLIRGAIAQIIGFVIENAAKFGLFFLKKIEVRFYLSEVKE
jgi:hypothetical protein